jgi:hypothetical protein
VASGSLGESYPPSRVVPPLSVISDASRCAERKNRGRKT